MGHNVKEGDARNKADSWDRKISGKVVPDDRISLQAETTHASRNSDGHAAIFDKKLFIVFPFMRKLAYERVSAVEHVGEATSEQHVNK